MDAIAAMTTRRSIRKFTDAPVKPEDLETILNCGRLAPTGVNRQPWRFIVVRDPEMRAKVAQATDYGKFIANAPVVIVVATEDEAAACPNEDSAAATCNMLNAAHALGYGGCWIGANGYAPLKDDPSDPHFVPYNTSGRVGKVLGVPEGWRVMSVFCIGVPAEKAERGKKSLEEIVSYDHF